MFVKSLPLFFLLSLLLACSDEESATGARQMPPAAVTVEKPEPGLMHETITMVGSLKAKNSALLAAEISGRLQAVHIEDAQQVKARQILFEIGSDTLRAELKRAQALVNLRRQEKNRVESLMQKNVGSQNDVDQAIAELLMSEANLELAEAKLDKSIIRAPFAGKLGISDVHRGDYISAGDTLIELVQLDVLQLDFHVPETALSLIQVEDNVAVQIPAISKEAVTATITAVDSSVDIKTRSIKVRALLKNKNGQLRPGLFARIELPVKQDKKVLWVAEAAVFYKGDDTYVLTHVDGKSQRKKISIASRQQGKVAVVEGLNVDDDVVVAGHHKVPFDGMPLMIIAAEKSPVVAE